MGREERHISLISLWDLNLKTLKQNVCGVYAYSDFFFFFFFCIRPSPFFLRLPSCDRPKFLALKKESNYVVNPFFTLNSSFNHKNEHTNNIEFRWLIFFPTLR